MYKMTIGFIAGLVAASSLAYAQIVTVPPGTRVPCPPPIGVVCVEVVDHVKVIVPCP